jgi:hypothetical protein
MKDDRCTGNASVYHILNRFLAITGAILSNGNKSSSFHSFLTHGAPLAYEVNFIKVEGFVDNHIVLFVYSLQSICQKRNTERHSPST